MGNTSSQPLPDQTQNTSTPLDNTQDSLLRLEGADMDVADMDDPALRDNDILVKKKKRKISGDPTRPLKRPKTDRAEDVLGIATPKANAHESQDADGDAQEDATEGVARKRSKKRSKKELADGEDAASGAPATQDSLVLENAPQSTADTTNGGDTGKRVKSKRKRPTGRPSGLNLVPAGMSDPMKQEEPTQEQSTQEELVESDAVDRRAAVDPSEHPEALRQTPSKKSKHSKRAKDVSGHLSPEMTNVQSSQPALKKTRSPKAKKAQPNGTAANGHNDEEPSPVIQKTVKSPKASKKRRAASKDDAALEMLPTPPNATHSAAQNLGEAPTPPLSNQGGDEGALRDDYSEVDATNQVQGWLSSQLQDDNLPSTPRVPDSILRKKATLNASAKREQKLRSEELQSSKKRRRASRHLEDDSEDYEPKGHDDEDAVEKKLQNSSRRKSKQNKEETDHTQEEPAKQDQVSPVASKKRRASSKKDADPKDDITPRRRKSLAERSLKSAAGSVDGTTSRKAAAKDESLAKGPFTATEKTTVDNIFKETVQDTDINEADLRVLIKNWKDATDFKAAVHFALPNRSVAAIRKFCQRRYHDMERGAWSLEDDASLKNAYAANPDKWTEISHLVGRTAADCKDRWKNTVSIEDTLQLGPWSQEETAALTDAVDKTIKELQKADKSTKNLSRTELDSMISWSAVSKKLNGTRSAKRCNEKWQKLKRGEAAERSGKSVKPLATGLDPSKSSKKLRLIEHAYNQCDVGDLYDILTEIHTAIPDHSKHYEHESTLWAVISLKNKGSRFKSAMRRRGLHDAAEVYADEIDDQLTIAAKAKALAEYLERQWGADALEEKRSFVPKDKAANKIKSSERVESDDDADEVITDTPPTSNEEMEASEPATDAEVPDSQPAVSKDHGLDESTISFKPINQKREQTVAGEEEEEEAIDTPKRKKSSKKTKAQRA